MLCNVCGKRQGKWAYGSEYKWSPSPSTPCNTRGAMCALPAFKVEIDALVEGVWTWKLCSRLAIPQLRGTLKKVLRKPHSSGVYVSRWWMVFVTYCAARKSAASKVKRFTSTFPIINMVENAQWGTEYANTKFPGSLCQLCYVLFFSEFFSQALSFDKLLECIEKM